MMARIDGKMECQTAHCGPMAQFRPGIIEVLSTFSGILAAAHREGIIKIPPKPLALATQNDVH